MDFSKLFEDLLGTFSQAVFKFVSALIIFVIGYIISKIVSKAIKKLLLTLKVDRLGDKLHEIDLVNKANIDVKISSVFSRIVYYFMLLFFVVAATDVLVMPAISNLVKDVYDLVPNLLVAGIILIVGILFAEALRKVVKTACESLAIPSAKMISMIVFYFIVINVLISALTQAKINTVFLSQNISLVIGGAILAFAIGYGLASKETVSNMLAFQYLQGKVKVGDLIKIDDVEGEIIEMDRSSVTLENTSDKTYIPLHHLSKGRFDLL